VSFFSPAFVVCSFGLLAFVMLLHIAHRAVCLSRITRHTREDFCFFVWQTRLCLLLFSCCVACGVCCFFFFFPWRRNMSFVEVAEKFFQLVETGKGGQKRKGRGVSF
jgi:hypothetical protein